MRIVIIQRVNMERGPKLVRVERPYVDNPGVQNVDLLHGFVEWNVGLIADVHDLVEEDHFGMWSLLLTVGS